MMYLNNLPDVTFVTKDVETILSEMITNYQDAYYKQTGQNITLYPGDEIRIFLYSQALREFQLRQLIDYSAKQNLLKYAVDDYLDNLGAFQDTPRLQPDYAVVTEQFNLSAPQSAAQTIPKGTRITLNSNSNGIYFATTEDITVTSGDTSVTAVLECTKSGSIGNGFTPGQLNVLADPLPWIASVINLDVSQGGSDIESNDNYRERIHEAPEGFSVAGPSGAYECFAKAYSQSVSDVRVSSPSPGTVDIRILLNVGELPTTTFLQEIGTYLSDKTRRPLTDYVIVNSPEVINYDITLTYYISTDNSAASATIQTNVNKAVTDCITWQKSRIGRDINPSELISRIINAGAKRVVLTNPSYIALTKTQVAFSENVTVTYGGLEDD